MKKYEKPTLEVVQLRVKENLAATSTTKYESLALGSIPTLYEDDTNYSG